MKKHATCWAGLVVAVVGILSGCAPQEDTASDFEDDAVSSVPWQDNSRSSVDVEGRLAEAGRRCSSTPAS